EREPHFIQRKRLQDEGACDNADKKTEIDWLHDNEWSQIIITPMKGLFQSRDGTAIYYETAGKGRPLIFCYGLMCRRDHWRRQLPHFESRYQIVQFDYRGHQRSALPRNDRNLTLEWCAKDIQDLMNFLNLEEAVCLGHSVGVPVLTHLAV